MRSNRPNKVRISVTVDPVVLEQVREKIGMVPLSKYIQALLKQELGMKGLTKDETGMTSVGGIIFGLIFFFVFWFIIWSLFFNKPPKKGRKSKK
jgi:hypothetical protein